MVKFYSFLDFSSFSVQGSTNFLTHYLKAFIAAGIKNQVIALYDNDSAGLAELEGLRSIRCPNNFKIMHLPDIEIAKHYPTLGPTGKEIMNINGKACSIEMFLGEDVLKDPEGTFFPVHWKGFVEKTDTYQGEVIRKQDIQKRFRDKLETANQQGAIDREEWREMNILLKAIFSAFR